MLKTNEAEVNLNGLEGQTKIVTPTLYTWILRFVVGWDYFDGGLRKIVLAPDKLAVGTPTFVLNKLVSFLPHAGFFKSFLLYALANPSFSVPFIITFSALEMIIGILLIVGFITRLAAFGGALMAVGFQPAFWLGATCEDEWQIGILLFAASLTILLVGAGRTMGLDYFLYKRFGDRGISKKIPILKWIKLW
jgi:thiosulfate dehydrogenase [quinone] large subunit